MTDSDSQAGVKDEHRANDALTMLRNLLRNERRVLSVALCLLIAFAAYDFLEDRALGASAGELFSDISDVFLPLLLLGYIWRFKPMELFIKNSRLTLDLEQKQADLQHWKSLAQSHLKGLSETIDKQFDRWQLTPAEKEVALLLLKGVSMRELAEIRDVSERTVRQQATRVYEKAKLSGRAELSAFFLEDLMIPS